MVDWAGQIPVSKDELRASLDLATVVYEELGVSLSGEDQGNCPFHDDSRPSFAVFESEDGVERAGCWACGWRGDVFDVIRAARSCSFSQSLEIAREYAGRTNAPRRVRTSTVRDFSIETAGAMHAYASDPSPVNYFIQTKGYPWTAYWLHTEFYVGVASYAGYGSIFIPHLDPQKICTGYKHRTGHTPPVSAGGSRFPHLYGIWRDDGTRPVVITEGESDTWSVTWYVPEVIVLGLPTGAATALRSEWLVLLGNRDVTICLDGDEPGRQATERWVAALPARVIELPEGVDAVGMGHKIRDAILVG